MYASQCYVVIMELQIGDLVVCYNGKEPVFGIIKTSWNDSITNGIRFKIMWLNIDWPDDSIYEQTTSMYRKNYLNWRKKNLNNCASKS